MAIIWRSKLTRAKDRGVGCGGGGGGGVFGLGVVGWGVCGGGLVVCLASCYKKTGPTKRDHRYRSVHQLRGGKELSKRREAINEVRRARKKRKRTPPKRRATWETLCKRERGEKRSMRKVGKDQAKGRRGRGVSSSKIKVPHIALMNRSAKKLP